ncbi:glycosyltransferase family 2 protein [bacterium]|nr:MAG: glycosyltransferase family 2 protein [bacterium]
MADIGVCVVIAARNASGTISRAINSALDEKEVTEVFVVDDASTDNTYEVARNCQDGTNRLKVCRLDENQGPSKARNVAIDGSNSPFIAILDADDFLLPGRFEALFTDRDWDIIADNVAFISDDEVDGADFSVPLGHRISPRFLDAAAFVEGCISRSNRYKGELGFLKPIVSRAFLDRHQLRYSEDMRLSEDYDLYVRALVAGATFKLAAGCYYVAVERTNSLSVVHGASELTAVDVAMGRLRAMAPSTDLALQGALRRHHVQISRKRRHRAVLAKKRHIGVWRAMRIELGSIGQIAELLVDVLGDKLRALRPVGSHSGLSGWRFLL